MLLDNLLGIFRLNLSVEGVIGNHFHDGAFLTEAEATGHDYFNLVGNAIVFNDSLEALDDFRTARSLATRTATAEQLNVLGTHSKTASLIAHSSVAQFSNFKMCLSFLPELD